MQPQIIAAYDGGKHNEDLPGTLSRLTTEGSYKDLSTVIVIPALGSIPTKAVASWWNMYTPPNQKVAKFFALGMEVGAAYSQTIEGILANPELSMLLVSSKIQILQHWRLRQNTSIYYILYI